MKVQLNSSCCTRRNKEQECYINTFAPGRFWEFLRKKRGNARGFAREFMWSGICYWPGQSLKWRSKSCSLHSKKLFW